MEQSDALAVTLSIPPVTVSQSPPSLMTPAEKWQLVSVSLFSTKNTTSALNSGQVEEGGMAQVALPPIDPIHCALLGHKCLDQQTRVCLLACFWGGNNLRLIPAQTCRCQPWRAGGSYHTMYNNNSKFIQTIRHISKYNDGHSKVIIQSRDHDDGWKGKKLSLLLMILIVAYHEGFPEDAAN